MTKNYIISNTSRKNSYFRNSFKTAVCFLVLGSAVNLAHAQNSRAVNNSGGIARINSNEQLNDAISKQVVSPVLQSKSSKKVALNGLYTVGATGNYATLTAAVADFNSAPITGAVTFELLDATYPGETFPIVISANAGSSAANTLTVKPATGVDAVISGSGTAILKIDGADYVTIDGSNNGTGSDNLTLNNVNPTAASSPVVAWVASTATDGADHVTFKNVKFLGFTPAITVVSLVVSGPTLGGAGTIPNNYLTVESNVFNRAQNALFAIGLATAPDVGAVITGNTVGSTDPLEKMGFRGIAVQNASDFVISKNDIKGVTISSTSTTTGILVGAVVNNGVVTQNNVTDISNTNAGGYGANGIYTNAFVGSSNLLVSNNFVSEVTGYGYAALGGIGDNGNGIVVGNVGTGIKIYNNTVALNKNQNVAGRPSAINILSTATTPGSIDIRNNIFVNNQTTTGARYTIYSSAPKASFSNVDFNDYYTTGPNLAYIAAAPVLDLPAVVTAFGGNTNSKNVNPVFVSATDLHLTPANGALNNKGTALPEVTVDIDNTTRSLTKPDMGADEFSAALSGVYKVGVLGDYVTLTAAVADFNAFPIGGAVTFDLIDSTYPTETFPIVINANSASSATNTLTVKPATGVDAVISGSGTAILKIDGADYVTIDGSNNGTGSDNLTLNNVNTTAASSPVVAWVASTATDGADHVTFKNVKFLGFTPAITVVSLVVSGPTLGGAGTIPNNYLTVESNVFNRAQNALFAIGLATAPDVGAVITGNTVGSTDPLEKMGFRGIAVQNASDFVISKNDIKGVTISSTSTTTGILVGAVVNNGVVTQNNVTDISNTNAGGYGANGIYTNAFVGSSNLLVSNNFVSEVTGYGYAALGGIGDNGNGIVVGNVGTGIKIYNNTVALNKNQNVAGRPSAINILSTATTPGSIDIRNNIFVNNQTTTGARYTIYSSAPKASFSNVDFNDYYTTGPNLAYIGAAPVLDLPAVVTAFGGNTNSKNVNPVFVSATDLHMSSTNLAADFLATPLAEVTVDFDNESRSATTPDMGADEFTGALAVNGATKNVIKLYPNPVVDFVNINNPEKISSVEIYNVAGQKVASQKWNATSGTMDMRNLTPGMYIIKLNVGNDVQFVKVIKK